MLKASYRLVDFESGTQIERDGLNPMTGKAEKRVRTVSVRFDQMVTAMKRYHDGQLIQDAFPFLSDADREFIMSGMSTEEWDEAFGEDV